MAQIYDEFIKGKLELGKPDIGFGLKEPDSEILESLERGKKYANITLIGPKAIESIEGFKKVIDDNPEKKLANMIYNNEFEGIIRGTIDDFLTLETYQSLIGKELAAKEIELILLEDIKGRQFYLSECSNPRGWDRESKMHGVIGVVDYMKNELCITPKVGFLTGIRHDTFTRRKENDEWPISYLKETYEDAQYGVEYFTKEQVEAKNYAIELSTALDEGCNIIVPPNGMVGNQIFRSLCLVGGGRIVAAQRANMPHPWEDNSRNEKDFEPHVKWLAAWINGKKMKQNTSD